MNLVQSNQVVESVLEDDLEASVGLSLAEFEVLSRLSRAPAGGRKMSDIANLLLASKSGITRIVDRLERDGLVLREIPPENRRVVRASITSEGRKALARAKLVFARGLDQAFSQHLSDADIRMLRRILRKLLVGNGAWEEERCSLKSDDGAERSSTSAAAR